MGKLDLPYLKALPFLKGNLESKAQGTTQSPPRHPSSVAPMALALEPRFMFDAAGAVTGAEVAAQAAADTIADAPPPTDAPQTQAPRQDVVFIDETVKDSDVLANAVTSGVDVVVLDKNSDGLEQIAAYLKGKQGVDGVSIVTHGDAGNMWLGSTFLNSDNLADNASALSTIGAALSADADILLYACETAQGSSGETFVQSLADLTGADVAASDDRTGGRGDWVLEVTTGVIETAAPFATSVTDSYAWDLATITVTSNADSGAGTLRQAITDAAASDTIAFNASMTITLTTKGTDRAGINDDTLLLINKNLTITGGANTIVIDGGHNGRVFEIGAGSTVSISNLTIQNGLLSGNGGSANGTAAAAIGGDAYGAGIKNLGTLTLDTITVTANKASGGGGSGDTYAGGGGGGFSGKGGGAGGTNYAGVAGGAGGAGTGGNGGDIYHGKGGGTTGGAGGNDGNATRIGGTGGSANAGGNQIGGGGGASGYASDAHNGGRGGHAAGGIFNSGTLTLTNTTLSNNAGASGAGGGAGGAQVGGTSGRGVGALWNIGTLNVDGTSNGNITSGSNAGVSGTGGTSSSGLATSLTADNTIWNDGNNDGTEDTTNLTVGPDITSATYSASTGALVVTGTSFLATGGVTNDVIANKITLTGEGGATYTLTDTSNVELTSGTSFTLTLSAADKTALNLIMNSDGTTSTSTTTYDVDGATGFIAASSTFADTGVNGVTVSGVATPTIAASAAGNTYNASTGVLTVTATGLTKFSGATNDIDLTKLTFTGAGTTYTLTSTTGVEITNATSFSTTLNATDKAALNLIMNSDGTASTNTTAYNLAAAEDWAKGAASGVVIADLTGNGLTVSGVATPTIAANAAGNTYNASTGVLTVAGTGFTKSATSDIDLTKLTFTGAGTTYTLTSTAGAEITNGTSFSTTLNATDKAALNLIMNSDGTASTNTTAYNLAAAEDWAKGAASGVTIADLTGNGLTVSGVPAPTIAATGTTYNASTGVLTVAASGLTSFAGATNDIDLTKLTFTGAGTTYTLTSTTGVEITNATSFSTTLNATDKAALNLIMNSDGTASTNTTAYNLAAAEDWARGAATGVTIADLTGNGLTVSGVAAPQITSSTYDYNSNVLTVTGTGFTTFAGATNDIDLTKLTVTGGNAATYTLTNTTGVEITSATSFAVTLTGADLVSVESLLNANGSSSSTPTVYNLAAAEDWAKSAATGVTIADLTSNPITVSSYAAPTVTSATYDVATGALVVTGTNFVNASGATNDITANLLTLTGEGGSYTLTNTANVEVTSATSFTLTLSATDQLNMNGLLNKNGTASSGATTYNLAAADNWMAGSPAATDIADATGNGVTASNVATPTISSAVYDSDTGVVSVTGTNLFKKVGATNDIDISTLTFTGGTGNATYTMTSANDVEITSATAFSFTLSGADKTNVDALLDQIGTSSSGGSTYNIAGADNWLTGADAAANIADATNAVTVSINPKVTSATYNTATGSLLVTGTNIQANGGGADIDASMLTLTGEGGATYTLTDTADVERTNVTSFTLTLSATDKAALNQIMNKDGPASTGTTTYNVAAADNWNTNVTAGDTSDATGNGITVSNVAVPAITSTTYDAATGSLVVTGTGFTKFAGATNDIDVSMFTFTGEGSTYTLTDSSDVEITSGTAFTVTLSATDKAALNQIINKNGTASTNTVAYNLNAAENWTRGADGAVNVVDATGNGVTASNVAVPAITSTTYDAATGSLVVTGTGFTKFAGATNDIDVSMFTFTGEGSTYTLTDSSDVEITSGTAFTVTLSATDKAALNQIINKNGAASTNTVAYNLNAAENWTRGADSAVNVVDATGNGVTASNVAVPAITSTTYDAAAGSLVVTGTGFTKFAGATNDIDVSMFTFTGEGSTYTLTDSSDVEITSGTAFTVTLSATDKAALNQIINKNGTASTNTVAYNLNAAENWTRGADGAVNVVDATGNGVTASNVAVPAITSTTYDAATGSLVVTGTGFTKFAGATNDIDVSMFTFTGEGSTYTLTDSSDVEITSGTAFTVTLSATDKAALNQIINKNGTASTNTVAYNLNAAENWTRGADSAVNVVDATGNGMTASNVAVPAITSAAYDGTNGTFVVTGTGFSKLAGATNDIDVSMFTFTGEGSATHTLTDSSDVEITSGTTFTVSLSATDLTALRLIINKDGATSTDATTYNVAAAEDWAKGAAAVVNVVDATGNGVTASNTNITPPPTNTDPGLNITQRPPSGGTPPPPPPGGDFGEGGEGGFNDTAPPPVPPIPTVSGVGQTRGPSANGVGHSDTFITGQSFADPGGIDVSAIVGNAVGGHSDLVDSFYGAGRTDASTRSGGTGGTDGAGGTTPSSGFGGFASLVGDGVMNNLGGAGLPGQNQAFGFGEGEGDDNGNGENGPLNGGQGPNQDGQGDRGAPGEGAALQPIGRAGFSDQLALAADGYSAEMSRLAVAMEQAKEAAAA